MQINTKEQFVFLISFGALLCSVWKIENIKCLNWHIFMLGHFEFAITSEKKINKKGQKKLEKQVVLKINSWHILQLIRLIGKKEHLRKGESATLSIYKLWKNFWKTFLKVKHFLLHVRHQNIQRIWKNQYWVTLNRHDSYMKITARDQKHSSLSHA